MKSFGKAGDYYRARVQSITVDKTLSIDWPDDVLYKEQGHENNESLTAFVVQVVRLDDHKVSDVKNFHDLNEAEEYKEFIFSRLEDLTKNQFEERFSDKLD